MKISTIASSLFAIVMCLLAFSDQALSQSSEAVPTTDVFKFSMSDRFRIETYDNAVTLSKSAKGGNSFTRNRISIMGQWFPGGSLEVAAKATNEFRNYFAPSTNNFYMNEVFIDQFYVRWNTKSFLDGILTLGRQNIMLGEGFLMMDGSPLDGSRSLYFNAARYDWNITPHHAVTVLYTYQPKLDLLPVLNGRDIDPAYQGDGSWKLLEQTEAGGGVYYTGSYSRTNLQAYYLQKNYLDPDANAGQFRSDVNTLGSRLAIVLNSKISSTIEGAYQFGDYGTRRRKAYGGYLYVDYAPKWDQPLLPKLLTIGTVCLSGDDRSTAEYEGWDPVFSRWPKWSESYIYTQIKEFNGRPAYWSNLISFYSSLQFTIDDQVGLNITYHHMTAPQSSTPSAYPGGNGNVRGDMLIGKILFTMSQNVTGHILVEHFIPGNYYFDNADVSNWARIEFLFKL